MSVDGFAAAKINLSLHVTGRRADGYHLLDSLVCFAGVGDWLHVAPSEHLHLQIEGREGAGLTAGPDNLVLRAAALLRSKGGADLRLDKRLPVASGIGGGSADAAAALRVLARHWDCPRPSPAEVLSLGADVPVCLAGTPLRMQGIGEHLTPIPALPPLWAVLANPRVAVSTPAVFRALPRVDNPPMPAQIPHFPTTQDLAVWLTLQRNDMESAAASIAPAIGGVLRDLAGLRGSLLARMSGSGATCFALFDSAAKAHAAAADLRLLRPNDWIYDAALGAAADVTPQP